MLGLTFCVIVCTFLMWLLRTWILREARPRNDLDKLFGEVDKHTGSKKEDEPKESPRPMYSERLAEMEAQKLPPKPFLEELDDYLLKNKEFVSHRRTVRRAFIDQARRQKLDKVRKVLLPTFEELADDGTDGKDNYKKLEFKFGLINYCYNPRPYFQQTVEFLKTSTRTKSGSVSETGADPGSSGRKDEMLASTHQNRERFAIKKSYSIENGYPSRRRSLVGDARFETQVNKEVKRTWLEEIRQLSHDSELSEDDLLFVDDNMLPTTAATSGTSLGGSMEALKIAPKEEEDKPEETTIVITLRESMTSFARILKTIDNCKAVVMHVESRVSRKVDCQFDVLVKLHVTRSNLVSLIKVMRQSKSIVTTSVISTHGSIKGKACEAPWYPKHISELDLCNHLMTKFEPDLDMDHPGFADKVYRSRRKMIADIAFTYKYGETIPRVQYTADEIKTWGHVFNQLVSLLPTHACKQYIDAFKLLQEEVGYRADNIPQLQDISDFLQRRTGFTLRPAAGLLTARDFLASLAFRVFQCTQYVRHGSSPDHSPEPDCVHELLGHVPMLADPLFAQFSQELGLAALGASDEEIEKFSTLYWFTVEFGLCMENNQVKAYGAGLLSSYGELEHALSDKPEHRTFEPRSTAVQTYQDQDFQDIYFVAESFQDVKDKFRQWVQECMTRPYEVRYDPFTQTVHMLDSADKLEGAINQIKLEVSYLTNAVSKMKFQ